MAFVIWSPNARAHLRHIHAYIARDSVTAADRFLDKILQNTNQLELLRPID